MVAENVLHPRDEFDQFVMHLLKAPQIFALEGLGRREDAQAVSGFPTEGREFQVHFLQPFDIVRCKNRSHAGPLTHDRPRGATNC